MTTRLKYGLAAVALIGFGAVAAIVAAHLHFPARAPDPAPAVKPADPPRPQWFGGVLYPADGSHKRLIASMPRLAQAAPHLMKAGPQRPGTVLLYRAWTDLFAAYPPYVPQQIGDCTSFGGGHANDLLQTVEWVLANPGKAPTPADIQETDTEALYAMAREVAGMLGQGDGCYGGAIVKAMTEGGVVSRRMLGDAGIYSGRRAKAWGRRGAPDAVKRLASRYKLGASARVETWDELAAAVAAGHPVIICTQSGFELQRDAQGFARQLKCWPAPVGCGGHCMFIAGVRSDRPGACIVQSWGPDTPAGPTALGQPSYSFWAEKSAIESILAEGDSWAISNAPRFGASSSGRRLPTHWRKAS